MKKAIAIILCLTLTFSLIGCGKKETEEKEIKEIELAENAKETEEVTEPETEEEKELQWYELSADDTVLTIRLEANGTTGYEWNEKISDEELLETITTEYITNQTDKNMAGVGGVWVGSFKASGDKTGEVILKIEYKRNWEEKAIKKKLFNITVNDGGKLEITGVSETEG